jgi:hypothetical protein
LHYSSKTVYFSWGDGVLIKVIIIMINVICKN